MRNERRSSHRMSVRVEEEEEEVKLIWVSVEWDIDIISMSTWGEHNRRRRNKSNFDNKRLS